MFVDFHEISLIQNIQRSFNKVIGSIVYFIVEYSFEIAKIGPRKVPLWNLFIHKGLANILYMLNFVQKYPLDGNLM